MRLARPVTHVVFDLDGVLLDTECLYSQATEEILARFGLRYDWSLKAELIGRRAPDAAAHLVRALGLPLSAEDYQREREQRLAELFPGCVPMAGAPELIAELTARGAGLAIATSSSRRLFELKTKRHRDWLGAVRTVVAGDDPRVGNGKPAPDIFLVTAAELGVAPAQCVVVEDAPAGVEAAHAAGMQVVAVPDGRLDRARVAAAELVVPSLRALTAADLGFRAA